MSQPTTTIRYECPLRCSWYCEEAPFEMETYATTAMFTAIRERWTAIDAAILDHVTKQHNLLDCLKAMDRLRRERDVANLALQELRGKVRKFVDVFSREGQE